MKFKVRNTLFDEPEIVHASSKKEAETKYGLNHKIAERRYIIARRMKA